uniref:Uso1_p115_head domain-containing protein n=1 Tax=Rhabditophanes sp. KR3021 TaxID=114890 RepID=A0AC35UCR8_9BILA
MFTVRGHELEVAKYGLDLLIQIANQNVDQAGVLEIIFEIWKTILTPGGNHTIEKMFVMNKEITQCLSDVSFNFDFVVRRSVIQLMTVLVRLNPVQIQDVMSSNSEKVGQVTQLLKDERDGIKKNVVLLIAELVKDCKPIQNLFAESSIFKDLFLTIHNLPKNSIECEDCLFIVLTLLKGNTSIQVKFLDDMLMVKGLIECLNELMFCDDDQSQSGSGMEWNSQQSSNILFCLECIRMLVSVKNEKEVVKVAQDCLHTGQILKHLARATFDDTGLNMEIIVKAIITTGEVIRGNKENQLFFLNINVKQRDADCSLMSVLMRTHFDKNQPRKLKCAIIFLFDCLSEKNANLNSTTIGSCLSGISNILQMLLHDGTGIDLAAGCIGCMHLLFNEDNGAQSFTLDTLVDKLMRTEKSLAQDHISLAMLMCVWIQRKTVNSSLPHKILFDFIVNEFQNEDYWKKTNDMVTIKGLHSLIVGLMMVKSNEMNVDWLKDVDAEKVTKRIAQYLDDFVESEGFKRVFATPQVCFKNMSLLYLDHKFCLMVEPCIKTIKSFLDTKTPHLVEISAMGNIEKSTTKPSVPEDKSKEIRDLKETIISMKQRLECEVSRQAVYKIKVQESFNFLKKEIQTLQDGIMDNEALKEQIVILSENVSLWQSETLKYKDLAGQWREANIGCHLNTAGQSVCGRLSNEIKQQDLQLLKGFEAYESLNQKYAKALIGIKTKERELASLKGFPYPMIVDQ